VIGLSSSRIASACRDSGTRCGARIFIRSSGINQTFFSKSNSSHRAPRSSMVRTMVKRIRRSASWIVFSPLCVHRLRRNDGRSSTGSIRRGSFRRVANTPFIAATGLFSATPDPIA